MTLAWPGLAHLLQGTNHAITLGRAFVQTLNISSIGQTPNSPNAQLTIWASGLWSLIGRLFWHGICLVSFYYFFFIFLKTTSIETIRAQTIQFARQHDHPNP